MRASAIIVDLILATSVIAAPLREKNATPISSENVQHLREIGSLKRDAFRIDWIPRTAELAVMPWEDEIEVFDGRTLNSTRKLAAGKRLVQNAFSKDGRRFAWAENNSSVTIEDLKTGKSLTFDTGNSQPSMAFSPDGKWLATGSGGRACMWDVSTGKKLRDFETDTEGGITPVFSPNGKILAVGNRNSDARLFDAATGKLLHILPKGMTQEVQFNPAGTVLATTYVDGSIGLWDVASGKSLHLQETAGEELYSVDWSPKGDLLVTSGRHAKIILWDAKTLKPLKELDAPDWVIRARFSPDGSRLFTAGGSEVRSPDRKITIWGLVGMK